MSRLPVLSFCFLTATCVPSLALAVTSGEVYTTTSYAYGRFEARLRFAAGDGVVSSFFLWKDGSEVAGTFWNELDFEKLGADCHVETNSIFGNPSANHIQRLDSTGDACGDYHTYAYEWTPEYIAWFIDGMEVRRDTGANATAYSENASAGMQLRFNVWPGDASFGGNFDPAILPVHQYIDWVQYSSYSAGAFTVAWREDFDNGALPTGWAAATWGSPKNLSTHDPRNVNFVDGALVISLTTDEATGAAGAMPGLPPGSGGMPGSGGTGGSDAQGGSGMTAGTGGTAIAGTGGTMTEGSGGSAGSAGSSVGTGGTMATPGVGGSAAASGGTTSTGGSSVGVAGMSASGGTGPTGQGGSAGTAGPNDSGGTGTAGGDASSSDGGCSVSASGARRAPSMFGLFGLFTTLLTVRLRRRSRTRTNEQ